MKVKETLKANTVVYIGPTINGVAIENTTFNNGISPELQAAIKRCPAIGNLCIPVRELSGALKQLSSQKGSVFEMYKAALKYQKGE
nr:MAG TPA: hypothetical protein [Caudoviricetes sp.]